MQNKLLFDRFELRPDERLLLVDGQPVEVGARAFDLLLVLIEQRDRVLAKKELLNRVWPGLVVEENNLSVQVSALRKLLGARAIATVAGRGYRFSLPVREAAHVETGSASLADAAPPVPTATTAAATPEKATIAVLPFAVLSDDPRLSFLADGLVEDVIALLARVPGFLLIAHASSSFFRARDLHPTDVARQLGVRYLVSGSLRSTGEQLRVATQLIEAQSGHVLWSGRFDSLPALGQATDDLQDRIARGIMSELQPELTRAEIALIRRQRSENWDAWAHFHQAMGAMGMGGWNEAAMAQARAQLSSAISLDPSFGLAYAYHALLSVLGLNTGLIAPTPGLKAQVLEFAERAIDLDPGSAEVLGYAGCALSDLGERERGAEVLQMALQIDPSNAQAHVALGAAMATMGQLDAGIDRMRLGMRISPKDKRLSFWGWALGVYLLRSNQNHEALDEARASSRRDPQLYLARVLEAAALERLGQPAQATAALARALQLRPGLSLADIALTHGRRVGESLAQYWGPTPTQNQE